MQGLASSAQTRVADWRRETGWEMVELKDHQQQEAEGQLQFHPCLTMMAQVLLSPDSIPSTRLEKQSSDVLVVALFTHYR